MHALQVCMHVYAQHPVRPLHPCVYVCTHVGVCVHACLICRWWHSHSSYLPLSISIRYCIPKSTLSPTTSYQSTLRESSSGSIVKSVHWARWVGSCLLITSIGLINWVWSQGISRTPKVGEIWTVRYVWTEFCSAWMLRWRQMYCLCCARELVIELFNLRCICMCVRTNGQTAGRTAGRFQITN